MSDLGVFPLVLERPPRVKDGQYGPPPRQRYRCIGEVVNPKTGEVRQ
jgi:hypothetical protein